MSFELRNLSTAVIYECIVCKHVFSWKRSILNDVIDRSTVKWLFIAMLLILLMSRMGNNSCHACMVIRRIRTRTGVYKPMNTGTILGVLQLLVSYGPLTVSYSSSYIHTEITSLRVVATLWPCVGYGCHNLVMRSSQGGMDLGFEMVSTLSQ